jgi:hydrogenase-4 component B
MSQSDNSFSPIADRVATPGSNGKCAMVSDPILMFLAVNIVAMLALATCAPLVSIRTRGLLATGLCGLGVLLCLPPMLGRMPATMRTIPFGPPSLSMHLALDPLAAFFLLLVFLSGTAVAALQANTNRLVPAAPARMMALYMAGTTLSLLAADAVTLTIGMTLVSAAIWFPVRRGRAPLLIPLLLLAAICLLTPAGFIPRFDTIRAAPIYSGRAAAAAALTIAAATCLAWGGSAERCWTKAALTAGAGMPAATYLLLRIIADLSASAAQSWWGDGLLFAGGSIAVIQSWRSAAHPDVDDAIKFLLRRQIGLAMIGIGLGLICRTEDLPAAASFAFAASFLVALGGSVAGTSLSIAASAIGSSAGTYRLSRLGGLVHSMPAISAALAAGLVALSALPCSLGFACLWLSFEAILSAPRTGGLLWQLPLALAAGAIALSAAVATAATLRLAGIALLGRPRSPSGAGAGESRSPARVIPLALAGIALVAGMLPGSFLWLLADPSIWTLAGIPPGPHTGFSVMSTGSSGYLPLSVLALVALATGAVIVVQRRMRKEVKVVGPWAGGMALPVGLPFGEPAAQSAGDGFLPALPDLPLPHTPRTRLMPWPLTPSLAGLLWPPGILWIVLGGFAALLLVLAVFE